MSSRTVSKVPRQRLIRTRIDLGRHRRCPRGHLVFMKKPNVALHVALAGVVAWGAAELLHEILDPQKIPGPERHGAHRGRTDPSPRRTWQSSPRRRSCSRRTSCGRFGAPSLLLTVLVVLSAMYLGTAFPSDVAGGVFLGFVAAGAVLAVFGAPGGRPTLDEVRDGLPVELGFNVVDVQARRRRAIPRAAVMDVRLTSGEQLRVNVYGRDQRDGQVAAKVWH